MNWLSVSADNIVILILLLALAVKFMFFEDKGDIAKQLRFKDEEKEEEEEIEQEQEQERSVAEDNGLENMHGTSTTTTTALDATLRQRFGVTLPRLHQSVFPLSGMGGNWVEVGNDSQQVELEDKEVQTDVVALTGDIFGQSSSDKVQAEPRPVEECLSIYRSEVRNNENF